ncbi:MAG: aspartate dehydrogenase [Pseudomonadota bacterium]
MANDQPNRVSIIGRGSIAATVAMAIKADPRLGLVAVLVRGGAAAFAPELSVTGAANLPRGVVADCAGGEGLRAHGEMVLANGCKLFTLSAAALADDGLRARLTDAAAAGGGQLLVVSGAIGAIDALSAAAQGGLSRVTYTGRKPPAGWRGSPAQTVLNLDSLTEPAEHFRGDARAAALSYPKNANVAATVALAGLGFRDTEVVLIADPGATANTHRLEAEGAFGHFSAEFSGNALPDNPRSSAMAAYSMVAALKGEVASIRVG